MVYLIESIREQFNKRPFVILAGAAVILCISIYTLLGPWGQRDLPHAKRWYYDLKTRQYLAVDTQGHSSPLALPSGHRGVLAHMFICEGDEPDKKFVGYLEIEAPASKKATSHVGPNSGSLAYIALPPAKNKSPQWIDSQSAEATRIFNRIQQSCSPKKCAKYLP